MKSDSGLLVSRTEGEVEFWHMTFQEYLAALESSRHCTTTSGKGSARICMMRPPERKVVLLLAGCERRGGIRVARRMITRILETGVDTISTGRAVTLVGRILRDIAPDGGDPSQGTRYDELLRDAFDLRAG